MPAAKPDFTCGPGGHGPPYVIAHTVGGHGPPYDRLMPNDVRARVPGGTYFFTVVSAGRRPILTEAATRHALRGAVVFTRERWPFSVDALVLLPDHLHCVWTLPAGDADFSRRWSTIKRLSTQALRAPLWQPRFWEHAIRDDHDLQRHLDYVHGNPVKHGHAARARDCPYSSFHRYVKQGAYHQDWCDLAPDMDLD